MLMERLQYFCGSNTYLLNVYTKWNYLRKESGTPMFQKENGANQLHKRQMETSDHRILEFQGVCGFQWTIPPGIHTLVSVIPYHTVSGFDHVSLVLTNETLACKMQNGGLVSACTLDLIFLMTVVLDAPHWTKLLWVQLSPMARPHEEEWKSWLTAPLSTHSIAGPLASHAGDPSWEHFQLPGDLLQLSDGTEMQCPLQALPKLQNKANK